jgi:N-methylhydantoinase A
MVRAVKAVSTYRGRNPADFTLVAFGGNGGIFASELLRQLQMQRALIPPAAGVFSAVGLCVADVQFSLSRAFKRALSQVEGAELKAVLDALTAEVAQRLGTTHAQRVLRRARMRYLGQGFELYVPVPENGAASVEALREAFETEYARTYGIRLGAAYDAEIVALDVTALEPASVSASHAQERTEASVPLDYRNAYYGPAHGLLKTPVTDRAGIGSERRSGPWIIEEYEGTTMVPPDADVHVDQHNNIVIELRSEAST